MRPRWPRPGVRATFTGLIGAGFSHIVLGVRPPAPGNVHGWLAEEIIRPVRAELAAAAPLSSRPVRCLAATMGCVSGDRVLGVDGCTAGWLGIGLAGNQVRGYVHAQIDELVRLAVADGPLQVIGIDIPIGMPDSSVRRADLDARAAAGPRRASVFVTPVRDTLAVGDYRAAAEVNKQRTGQAISRQAFNLLEKIRQVDDWLPVAPCRVIEVHPELSFAEMAGAPLEARKSSWTGLARRRELLARAGIVLSDDLGTAGRTAGGDDVLDAAAAAWSARRAAAGQARRLPAEPERFSDQIDCAIWT